MALSASAQVEVHAISGVFADDVDQHVEIGAEPGPGGGRLVPADHVRRRGRAEAAAQDVVERIEVATPLGTGDEAFVDLLVEVVAVVDQAADRVRLRNGRARRGI